MMERRGAIGWSTVLVAAVLLECAPLPRAAADPVVRPETARRSELLGLLRKDCGSCHGMRLTGGLGPALTSEALRDRSADELAAVILAGRPGTPMPPWQPFLTEPEARWLAERLRSGDLDGP